MSDLETQSEWAHLLGRAMAGEWKGTSLEAIPTDMVTWDVWRKQHPQTTVMDLSRTAQVFTAEFYRDPQRFLFGFEVDGDAYALPMPHMIERTVHNFLVGELPLVATFHQSGAVTHLFEATVEGERLEFVALDNQFMQDKQNGSRWTLVGGQAVDGPMKGKRLTPRVGIMSFVKAWINFHPDSRDIEF